MSTCGHLAIWKLVIILGLLSSPAFADRVIEGRVTVVRDVDTIVVAGTPVRLNGVDGPETSTRVGREAHTFMAPYARRGSKTATFHESAVVRLMRSIVATPTLKSRAMARMDFPSLSMALT